MKFFLKQIYQNLKLIIRSKNNEIENIIECYLLNGKTIPFLSIQISINYYIIELEKITD